MRANVKTIAHPAKRISMHEQLNPLPAPLLKTASNTIKDPGHLDDRRDEPATGAQMSYLKTLTGEAKQDFDESKEITKSEASKMIEDLRAKKRACAGDGIIGPRFVH